jgi:flagellar hook protein FlgE
VSQQFTQGSITATDNPLDLAINGRGFFQVSDGASPTKYTRNGQFKVDRDGFIVNNAGPEAAGLHRPTPAPGRSSPAWRCRCSCPPAGIAPQATEIDMQLNLDSRKGSSCRPGHGARSTSPTPTPTTTPPRRRSTTPRARTVTLTYYFQRAEAKGRPGRPPTWNVYLTANGDPWAAPCRRGDDDHHLLRRRIGRRRHRWATVDANTGRDHMPLRDPGRAIADGDHARPRQPDPRPAGRHRR